ncbi:Metallo-dependent phosphatase-like protein [Dichotomocladium elegans]|nr:Metallo-dependent phosphatase-like protein [Dichotomocladium elegans]
MKPLIFKPNGKFKILQLADLHFTNEIGVCRDIAVGMDCRGDQTTIEMMEKLLDLEKPDLVVFSGDNVDGGARVLGVVSDARAATFKFAAPAIDRNIPWAAIFGNHDDENDLSREELLTVMERMPYSLIQRGPLTVSGFGNYVLKVMSNQTEKGDHLFTIYFLDSGSYIDNAKSEYDYIKQDQLDWLQTISASFSDKDGARPNAIAFFHIPIWEYHSSEGKGPYPKLGDEREHVSSPRKNATQVLEALKTAGDIRAIGCGHDHVNDYCLEREGIQLCYGGGLGVGGYGAGHLG